MFATFLTLAFLGALCGPGLILAFRPYALNKKLVLGCLAFNVGFFALLGLLIQALPWLVDPRFRL